MQALTGTRILLAVSGGIAAYKTPDLVRKLTAKGAEVRVVLTASAEEFVSPLALQAVSGNPVSQELLNPAAEAAMGHIELAKWADAILLAPATANIIAKIAAGIADDLLTTLWLATTAKLYLAPAMNQQMYKAQVTQENLSRLTTRGVKLFGPASGEQACGDVGPGRMLEPQELADLIEQDFSSTSKNQPLKDIKLMITAGPTREAIDPVRYISNHSSGKMGYALAQAALQMGANVTLVSGPVNVSVPEGSQLFSVHSAEQMLQATKDNIDGQHIFIGCAAVADYRPVSVANQKIKKTNVDQMTIEMVKNPDILQYVASLEDRPFVVGFAAETQDIANYAKQKMQRKKLDMIAANDVSKQNIGFDSDKNALSVFWPDGECDFPANNKLELARQLLELIAEKYKDSIHA